MRLFKIYYISYILLMILNIGCRKFVELGAPETLIVTENTYQTDETAIAAMLGIYTGLSDGEFSPYRIAVFTGAYTDELRTNSTSWRTVYQNNLLPTGASTNSIWTAIYKLIYQANAVYEGCNASTTMSGAVKKQLMAEALFVRGYCHFYLLNLYGDIPLVTSTDYSVNATLARTPTSEVYQQIIADLKIAFNDLNVNYVASNSVTTSSDRFRANKAAAAALLARVYLFNNQYAEAEAQTNYVLSNKTSYDVIDLSAVFLKNSKEAILQLQKPLPSANNAVTNEGYNFVLTTLPSDGSRGSSTITSQLLNAFDSIDKRKAGWIGKYTDTKTIPATDYYFPYKYKVDASASFTECSTVLRVAEMYLIRSESRAQQNKLAEAIADVDVIRKRAGISLVAETNPTIGKLELLEVILKERQLELFAEYGHRFFDLKRTGNIDAVMTAIGPSKQSNWSSYKKAWPIPDSEIGKNAKIMQNVGYTN